MTITPAITWLATTPLTAANLNLASAPTGSLGTNEVALTNLPALTANNTFLARSTTGAGNYENLDTTTTGLGFYTGAGGTITQATSKVTGFTLSKMCGQITTAGDILNAATIVSATWTNTKIAATDVICFSHVSGGTLGAYTINAAPGAGTATFTLRNNTAGNLTETLVINFVVLKGVSA